jgi:hypothetical protein
MMALLDLQGLAAPATDSYPPPPSPFSVLLCTCNSDLSVLLCGC